jgi:hypothetical protein
LIERIDIRESSGESADARADLHRSREPQTVVNLGLAADLDDLILGELR